VARPTGIMRKQGEVSIYPFKAADLSQGRSQELWTGVLRTSENALQAKCAEFFF
jgi:hypothetical protein